MSVPLLDIDQLLAAGPYPVSPHGQHVEQYDGDIVVRCTCGYVSLQRVAIPDVLECPLEVAERERRDHLRRLQAHIRGAAALER